MVDSESQAPAPAVDWGDADSVYGASIAGTETQPLTSSITTFREENGRTYHSYGSTKHWGPYDDKAQDQPDLSHQLWTLALKGEYWLAPVKEPQRILDIGTGTGIWVIDVADDYTTAQVKGIDLSPIQPDWIPADATFEVDDYNMEWFDENRYDLIQGRELLGTVPAWVELYRKAYRALKPGGWFDQAEPSVYVFSETKQLDESHPFTACGQIVKEAGIAAGMRFDIGDKIKGWMEEAGFVNVQEHRMLWAIGGWLQDEHLQEIGIWNLLRLDIGVSDFFTTRLSNTMRWSPIEIEVYLAKLRSALREKKLHGLEWAYFVWGQKPQDR